MSLACTYRHVHQHFDSEKLNACIKRSTNEKKKTGREKISGNVFRMLTSTKPKVDFTKSYSWQSRKSLFFLCQDLSKVRRRERREERGFFWH